MNIDPKLRNAVAEFLTLLSLAAGFVPELASAGVAIPKWLAILIAMIITVGNQWIKDTAKTPPTTP